MKRIGLGPEPEKLVGEPVLGDVPDVPAKSLATDLHGRPEPAAAMRPGATTR